MKSVLEIPFLRTERLLLRAFRLSDLDPLAEMHADPEVMRHMGLGQSTGQTRSRYETWLHMQGMLGHWVLYGHGTYAVEEIASGRLVGRAGLSCGLDQREPELVYLFGRGNWGKGFATEAACSIVRWGIGQLGRAKITSFIRPANVASAHVAAKLGAVHERTIERDGTAFDVWTYSEAPSLSRANDET